MGRATIALASRKAQGNGHGGNGTAVVETAPEEVHDGPVTAGQELVPAAQTEGPAAELVDRVQLVPAGVLHAENAAEEELIEILHGVRADLWRGKWIIGDVGLALHLRKAGWTPGMEYDKGILARIGNEADVSDTTARHAIHCALVFPVPARRLALNITLHHEVIGLPAANRDALLDKAALEGLTCNQMRAAVVKVKAILAKEEEAKRIAAAPPVAEAGGTGETPVADVTAAGTATENAPTENSPAGGTDTAPAAETPEKATRVRTVEIEPAYMHALPADLFARIVSFFAAQGMPNDAGMIGQCKAAHVVSTFVDMAVSGKLDRLEVARNDEETAAHKAYAQGVINTLARK